MTTCYQDGFDQLIKLYQYSGITLSVALFDELGTETRTFTADPSTDVLSEANTFANSTKIQVSTTGVLPTPLTPNTDYWIVDATPSSWKLALNPNGNAIDIVDAGSGTHTATERLPSKFSFLSAWVRLESNYQGSSRQVVSFAGKTPKLDYLQEAVFLDPEAYTFSPTSGDITYRWVALIVDGNITPGNTAGRVRDIYDLGSQQTIANGTSFTQTITPKISLV